MFIVMKRKSLSQEPLSLSTLGGWRGRTLVSSDGHEIGET